MLLYHNIEKSIFKIGSLFSIKANFMNSIDLINKIAGKHNITTGRAEMIISIIVERMIEKLKKDGEITITNFGNFRIQKKESDTYMKFREPSSEGTHIVFEPNRNFLETINSL
jgi:nucleoid DNA-binding protein